jgi:hypothetical protein
MKLSKTTAPDPALTLRDARAAYFAANEFGADGGYGAAWVDFKLGPIPMPFPNSKGRVRALRYHDLHHLVTGYGTSTLGELEISAWEVGSGCKDYWVAWQLNLGGLAGGMAAIPRRTFRAFLRGRRSRTLYGDDLDALLDRTVADVRAERLPAGPIEATAADYALFAAAWATGIVVGLLSLAALFVVGPAFALADLIRRVARRTAAPAH